MAPSIVMKHWQSFFCVRQTPIKMQVSMSSFSSVLTVTSDYQGLKRSRDPAVLGDCDIVVDVGAVYDESKLRFDHHQRGFTEVFGHGFSTKLSSAGLVYKYGVFGFF
jgi:uncharacterized UPF0160 family protein